MPQVSFANVQGESAPGAIKVDGGPMDRFAEEEPVEMPALVPMRKQPVLRKSAPKNIVQLARARLREVKAEVRRLRALEKERDQLERLIEAATNKPRATVREIKRSAG